MVKQTKPVRRTANGPRPPAPDPLSAVSEAFAQRWDAANSKSPLDDPAGWAKRKLNTHLWSKQREILNSIRDNRRTAVKSCHSAGKSFNAATACVWWIDAHPPGESFVVTSAPTGDQVKAILWREINRAHVRGKLSGRLNLTEWYDDTGELVAFGRKPSDTNPTAFQGIHAKYVLVILDEACGIPEQLWNAADSLTSNRNSRTLAIGNPDDPQSYFARVCEPNSAWNIIKISAFDTPAYTGEQVPEYLADLLVAKEWVEEKKLTWGEESPLYVSKVLGEFPTDSSDGVIPYSWANLCKTAEPTPDPTDQTDIRQGGFDVAGSERGDQSVLWVRNNNNAVRKYQTRSSDPEKLALWANQIAIDEELDYLVLDSIGIGWGVIGALRILSPQCEIVGFNASESALESDKFANKRAELWWNVGRENSRLQTWNLSKIDDDTLDELTKVKYKTSTAPNSKGKIIVELKDDIRERIGRSPDSADALLLAFSPAWGSTVTFGSYTAQRRMRVA